jgi:HPt (histidine-containing phosphotransfer) domain-containing protein
MMHASVTAAKPGAAAPPRALDREHLSRQTAGDPALEREVLEIFRRQARRQLFRLEAMTDPAARHDIAHTMKGSARGIGATRVADAAAAFEQAVARGTGAGPALAELAEAIAATLGEIETMLARN